MNVGKNRIIYIMVGLLAVIALLLYTTSRQRTDDSPQGLTDAILAHRADKDRDFRSSADSPLPDSLRSHFPGLKYYPVDLAFRVKAKFIPAEAAGTSFPPVEHGEKLTPAGLLEFSLMGKPYRLVAYRAQGEAPDAVFVPFLDATSGDETYGAGRYLDLTLPPDGQEAIVDFNYAYNPFCAYNPNYVCAKPPAANTLLLAVKAGEKVFYE